APTACTRCHADRKPAWAAATMRTWYGHDAAGSRRFADAFHGAEMGAAASARELAAISRDPREPAIVRASALARFSRDLARTPAGSDAVKQALSDADPLVRRAGLTALESLPPDQRSAFGAALLSDPSRHVRIEAARVMAVVRPATPPPSARAAPDPAGAGIVGAPPASQAPPR